MSHTCVLIIISCLTSVVDIHRVIHLKGRPVKIWLVILQIKCTAETVRIFIVYPHVISLIFTNPNLCCQLEQVNEFVFQSYVNTRCYQNMWVSKPIYPRDPSDDVIDDDVIKRKPFTRYWPFVRGIHRSRWIPPTKNSNVELWCFLLSTPEQTVE